MNTRPSQPLTVAASLVIAALALISCLDPQAGTVKAVDVTVETVISDTVGSIDAVPELGEEVAGAETVVDAVADGVLDIALDEGSDSDATDVSSDASPSEDLVEGLWLIGWSGGLDHFDWLRFEPLDASGVGAVRWTGANAGEQQALIPLSDCEGVGSWRYVADTGTDGSETVELTPPAGCQGLFYEPEGNDSVEVMVFSPVADGGWFGQQAIAHATIAPIPANEYGDMWSGHKYPSGWCDPDLGACSSPYPAPQ